MGGRPQRAACPGARGGLIDGASDGRAEHPPRLPLEVVVPLRWDRMGQQEHARSVDELARYLERLAHVAAVTVVDQTAGPRLEEHLRRWSPWARVLAQPPATQGPHPTPSAPRNGKVVAALHGLQAARHEVVVLADDDVRHDRDTLEALLGRVGEADLVRPQNVPTVWPWHARWDFARSLLARAVDHDWPGTFAVRRSTVLAAGGWADDVLFENLELHRTVRAHGGRVVEAPDVLVPRVPCSAAHFRSQRVRQAYDELARPWWFAAALAVWPVLGAALVRARAAVPVTAVVLVLAAEHARRAPGLRQQVPSTVALWAPVWVLERGTCAWLALLQRLRGGVPYAGTRLRRAARTSWWRARRGSRSRAACRSRPGVWGR